jgi:hypothetical protein
MVRAYIRDEYIHLQLGKLNLKIISSWYFLLLGMWMKTFVLRILDLTPRNLRNAIHVPVYF